MVSPVQATKLDSRALTHWVTSIWVASTVFSVRLTVLLHELIWSGQWGHSLGGTNPFHSSPLWSIKTDLNAGQQSIRRLQSLLIPSFERLQILGWIGMRPCYIPSNPTQLKTCVACQCWMFTVCVILEHHAEPQAASEAQRWLQALKWRAGALDV